MPSCLRVPKDKPKRKRGVARIGKKRHKQAMKRPLPLTTSLLLGLAALCTAPTAFADEPASVHRYVDDSLPPGSARTKLILTGAAFTTVFYLPVLGSSYLWPDHQGASQMRIPVVGPWLGLSKTYLCNTEPDNADCNDFLRVTGAVLLVLDGIGQAGGVGLMLEGLFMKTGKPSAAAPESAYGDYSPRRYQLPTYGRKDVRRAPLTFQSGDFQVTPVPVVGGGSDLGLAFVGRF